MSEKRLLAVILGLFMLLGVTYAIVTPVFEASDELWHYPMIQHLANGNPLPVQVFDPALAGPWKQEASQPPLYYYLGAALTFWLDTSDMAEVRWLNPHVDNGIITEDGNINLAIHDPSWNPWQGTLLAVRIVRLFSVFLSAGTVLLTYLIAKTIAPDRPEVALGAAAVNAFLPMFLFISGAVNNDNLAILLASLAVWLMVKRIADCGLRIADCGLRRSTPEAKLAAPGYQLLLGVVIGLALLTKEGTFALLPLAWGTTFMALWLAQVGENGRTLSIRQLASLLVRSLLHFALLLVPVLLIAGWWYYRNIVLYGDFLGWNAFIAVLGSRAQPASLAQLWDERVGFMMSFWGLFGGVNVPMPLWIYTVLNGVLLTAVFGFLVYLGQELRSWRLEIGAKKRNPQSSILRQAQDQSSMSLRDGFAPVNRQCRCATALPLPIANLLYFVASRFGLVVCLLFAFAVVFGLVQWATTTWSSQGRLVFTAVSALSILLVLGLVGWLPRRPARWAVGGLGLFMFGVAALAPWLWIQPAYQPPVWAALPAAPAVTFGDALRLVGYAVEDTAAAPGGAVWLTLEWEALAPLDRDWTVFVHLNDPVLGRPIAQRDMYPGQGLLATRLLEPGQRIVNRYRLAVPVTAVAPADLQVMVGLYDYATCPACQRLPITAAAPSVVTNQNAAQIGAVALTAVPGAYPNPTSVNFGNQLELVGFALAPRRALPGQTVDLTLYWRAIRPLSKNYTFFAQVVDPDTTRWAAQDLPSESLPKPTSQWPVGEVQSTLMSLTLAADTPADVYPIIIGLYTLEDGQFQRLQLVTANGRITQDDFLTLTLLRVDAP
ncbi:MAG: hypothetical protein IPM39_08560 [Chloroflexi bacterium]|nr:hypothetical protein [Chloroflexota bacterium]